MSRTIRKDNKGKDISEIQRKRIYRCRCSWCMSSQKKKIIDRLSRQEMVKDE